MGDDVRLAMAGDRQAFGRLVAATHPLVAAITLAITREREASAEATQDVFLSAWVGMRGLRQPESFLPWIRQMARYIAHSTRRRRERRAAREVAGEAGEALLAQLADTAPGPMATLLDAERRELLQQALESLTDDARECVILYYREGESAERVATLLGLTSAVVRKRLERARRRLRADLATRLGDVLRESAPPASATAAIVAALGSHPRDAHALAISTGIEAAVNVAALPFTALAGATVGLGASLSRVSGLARRLGRPAQEKRRFIIIALSVAVLFGVVLPLGVPELLWVWFGCIQGAQAFVLLHWLPRQGVRPTRRDVTRWGGLAIAGIFAVAWALSRMS